MNDQHPAASDTQSHQHQPPPAGYIPQTTNGSAIAALVVGILSFVICGPAGIAAWFLGSSAKKSIQASGGREGGEGLATAGQVVGLIAFALWVIVIGSIVAITLIGSSAEDKLRDAGSRLQ